MYPFKSDVKFDLVAYGTNNKGKISVESQYDRELKQWRLDSVELKTVDSITKIIWLVS